MNPELITQAISDPVVVSKIMGGAPIAILKDFGFMALLLCIGKVLRAKVTIFQDYFIPASVIAGFLGLILGPQLLDIIPFSAVMGKYAWLLVVALFATFPLGQKAMESKTAVIDKAGATFFYNLFAEVIQFAIAAVIGLSVIKWVWPDLHEGFAWMLPAGFAGGHGYATAIGGTLEKFGFQDAISVGMTMATIGLLVAIFGGIVAIRYATRKGYTNFVQDAKTLPTSLRTGILSEDERERVGDQTVSPMSIDPLAWHAALILAATLGGLYLTKFIGGISWLKIGGKALYMPEVCTAMIIAMVIQKVLRSIKMDEIVDKRIITRMGSGMSDFMVGFGIASVKISVVITYWQPLLFLVILGVLWVLFNLFVLAPKMFGENWFERGIFTFGWSTGVVAFGVTLLRIVDPDFKSHTLEDYGLAYILIAPIELFLVALCPVLFATYGLATTAVLVAASFGLLIAARALGYWHTTNKAAEPEREALLGNEAVSSD